MSGDWKSEVLRVMPIGVELDTIQISLMVRPTQSPYERHQYTIRVWSALKKLAGDDKVVKVGSTVVNGTKVAVWKRLT